MELPKELEESLTEQGKEIYQLIEEFGQFQLEHYSSPLLRQEIPKFDFDNPPVDPFRFAHYLSVAMQTAGLYTLTAPQIGFAHRVFVIINDPPMIMFNPEIIDVSDEVVALDETSVSFPGIEVKVKRPRTIKIRGTNCEGVTDTVTFTGFTARYIQHNISQLNGEIFSKDVTKFQMSLALSHAKKKGVNYKLSDLTN